MTTKSAVAINFDSLRIKVRSYYDIQKLRIQYDLRIKDFQRREIFTQEQAEKFYGVSFSYIYQAEKSLEREIKHEIRGHTVADWMMKVRGIGPTLSGAFMAEIGSDRQVRLNTSSEKWSPLHSAEKWITHPERIPKPKKKTKGEDETFHQFVKKCWEDGDDAITIIDERQGIECFPYVSTLWSYCGLSVVPDPDKEGSFIAPKRRKGQKSNWNPFMRTLAYKMSDSWIKCGKGFFREMYDREKEKQLQRGLSKGHSDMRARRKASKIFFCLAWEVWRKSEGLSTNKAYVIEKLGHESVLDPLDAIEEGT